MKSEKKFNKKRILIIILAVLVFLIVSSMVATKIIYDSIFVRYDAEPQPLDGRLSALVAGRQEMTYPCGETQLAGYLYRSSADNAKDTLIVVAPGFHAEADDYLWQIQGLVEQGWSVFAFDPTGSGASGGESYVGFSQELLDLDETLSYIEENARFGYENIALLGHSRGGYAVCCALEYEYDIAAVVSVSGVNSAMEGIMGYSTSAIGPMAYGNYGFLWLYQAMLFGTETVNVCADEAIDQGKVPVLVVHGAADESFPMDRNSVISHREEIEADTVEYLICSEAERDGHTSLLFAPDGTANQALMTQIHSFLERSIG